MAADLVFRGGTVLTGSRKDPITDRIAVADGLIVAVGADCDADGLVGSATTVVDLAGGALLPGFADGHMHPLLGGIGLLGADVRFATTIEDMLAAVAAWAQSHPDAEWVVGDAFDPTLAAEGRFDARWLDRVVPNRPVALRTMDYHTLWVNSEALRRAGIDASTAEPADGQIVRRTDGSPLGTLREWGAIKPVLELLPSTPLDQQVTALADVTGRFAAAGITWVQDAMVEPHHLPAWLAAAAADRLKVRANLGFSAEPGTWYDSLGGFVDMRTRVAAEASQWLTARTIKFFADGVIEAGTAALLEPYADCPHSHGMANWSSRS
ncbi:MAG: amidohydrolase family protein [Microlunatus sp.]|nr:amidohydrolase family protein [Microlunatus sp.]